MRERVVDRSQNGIWPIAVEIDEYGNEFGDRSAVMGRHLSMIAKIIKVKR